MLAGFISLSASPSFAQTVSYPLSFSAGWNLVGNSLGTPLDVKTSFATQTNIQSVWKWDAATARWAFYSPSLDAAGTLTTFAASKAYNLLATINPGEGYWVHASAPVSLAAQSGRSYSLAGPNLTVGWNLAATGDPIAPAILTGNLGVVTSLWAWDNVKGTWYFYAPSLVSNNTLGSYLQGKGYEDFGQLTLGSGLGFWVNYAGPAPPSSIQVSSLSATSVAPMTTLTIAGSGFNPVNSLVSVRFIPKDGSAAMTIPAIAVSSTSVTVPSPLFFDPTTSLSVAKTVDVDVIQYTSGTVTVSNTLVGLQVSAMPTMPAGTTTGALTALFLQTAGSVSTATQNSISSQASLASLTTALNTQNTDLNTTISALNSVLQNPGSSTTVILSSGAQLALNPGVLAASDQIIQAYLANAAAAINSSTPTTGLILSAARQPSMLVKAFGPVPPPPSTTPVGSNNSAYLAQVANFYNNLSGANPAISNLEKKLLLNITAEAAAGEFVAELGNASNVAVAMSLTWDAFVAMASSRIVTGEAPDGSELFTGAGGTLYQAFIQGLTATDLHGAVGIGVDAIDIMYLAATTYPPSPAISAGIGWAFSAPGGDTEVLINTGNKTLKIPVTPGSYDSTGLVVPLAFGTSTSTTSTSTTTTSTTTTSTTTTTIGFSACLNNLIICEQQASCNQGLLLSQSACINACESVYFACQ